MKYFVSKSTAGFAPVGSRRIIRKGKVYLACAPRDEVVTLYEATRTASRVSYSGGLSKEDADKLRRDIPVTLEKDVVVHHHDGPHTYRDKLPAGTEILYWAGGNAYGAGTLWFRFPGKEYLDL